MAARDYGQYSGITQALELVGERWAMLIVRDLLVGPRRYGELAAFGRFLEAHVTPGLPGANARATAPAAEPRA